MADKLRSFIENKDASGLGLTAAHISANPSMYEAARSSFFTLTIDGLENLSRAAYGGKDEVIAGEGYTAQSMFLRLPKKKNMILNIFKLGMKKYGVWKINREIMMKNPIKKKFIFSCLIKLL